MVILVLHHRFTQPILGKIITRLFIYCRGRIAYIDVSFYDLDIRQGKSTARFVRELCIFLRIFTFSHVLYNRIEKVLVAISVLGGSSVIYKMSVSRVYVCSAGEKTINEDAKICTKMILYN